MAKIEIVDTGFNCHNKFFLYIKNLMHTQIYFAKICLINLT